MDNNNIPIVQNRKFMMRIKNQLVYLFRNIIDIKTEYKIQNSSLVNMEQIMDLNN